jgi:hypothetical protein
VRAWYRLKQFWQALSAASRPSAPPDLAPELRDLFLRMPAADRAHGLHTHNLLAATTRPPDLLAAALLHDAGKSRPEIHLWDRVLYVLAARLAPAWLQRQVSIPGTTCWAGLVALHSHAEQGARLVALAGGAPRLVALIRHHHANATALGWPDGERELLEALQAADEES